MSTHALLLDELSGFKGEGNTKLTVDVILESNQQLNAIGEYELDLQKKGIKTIEKFRRHVRSVRSDRFEQERDYKVGRVSKAQKVTHDQFERE